MCSKKYVRILVAAVNIVLLIINAITIPAAAGSSYTFSFTTNGTEAVITGFSTSPTVYTDVIIPPAVTGSDGNAYTVVGIADNAFAYDVKAPSGCSYIKSLTVSEGTKTIGKRAFYKCTALQRVHLPKSLEILGASAFKGCSSLCEITLSEGLVTISGEAFYYCPSLKSVVIPSTVENIGASAFTTSSKLASVTLLADISAGLSNAAFLKSGTSVSGGTKFNVVSESVKTRLVSSGVQSGNIAVLNGSNKVLLYPGFGDNIPQVMASGNAIVLPELENRTRFNFSGWTDGEQVYSAGEEFLCSGTASVLTAVWSYDSSIQTPVTLNEFEECLSRAERDLIIKKQSAATKNEHISVSVNESTVTNTVSRDLFGMQYEMSSYAPFIDPNYAEPALTDEYKAFAASQTYKVPIARWGGNYTNGVNAIANLAPYSQRTGSYLLSDGSLKNDKVVYAQAEFIKSVLASNPNAKFIFTIGMDVQTPQESAEFVHFLLDGNDTEWGRKRQALGIENPVNVVGLELGNEKYGGLMGLPAGMESYNKVLDCVNNYCAVAKAHIDEIRSVSTDIELIPNLHCWLGSSEYFSDIWTRTVFSQLSDYCDVFTVHFYYGLNGREKTFIRVLDNLQDIYHQVNGYGKDARFAITEHGYQSSGSAKSEYTSHIAALADSRFFSIVMNRDDIFCANYHNVYGNTAWSSFGIADGQVFQSCITDLYAVYMQKVGDRALKTTVTDFGTNHIADASYADRSVTVTATAKGDNTMVLVLTNSSEDTSADIDFEFENTYRLVNETSYTAPNMYSKKESSETLGVVDIKSVDRNIGNFGSYTLGAKSVVFLTLTTDAEIPSEVTDCDAAEKDTVLYYNILDGIEADSDNVADVKKFISADRILYNGNDSSFAVYGSCDKKKWYLIADCSDLTNHSYYNTYTDRRYRYFKINGNPSDTAILSEADSSIYVPAFAERIKLYPRVGGVDCFNSYGCSAADNKTLAVENNLINIKTNSGEQAVSVTAGGTEFNILIKPYLYSNYYVFSDDFDESDADASDWSFDVKNGSPEYLVSNAPAADGEDEHEGKYLKIGSVSASEIYAENQLSGFNGDTKKQLIKFDVQKSDAATTFRFRFMIHNDGKNYYEFEWNPYSSNYFADMWMLCKVEDNVSRLVSRGSFNGERLGGAGRNITFAFLIENGKISWTADYKTYNNGYPVYNLSGSAFDDSPFDAADTSISFGKKGKGYICIDNVSVESLVPYDGLLIYSQDGAGLKIEGMNRNMFAGGKLEIPESIDGKNVVSIADSAFGGMPEITEIVLPATLRSIGSKAFEKAGIRSLTIPDSVDKIGARAFQLCVFLNDLTFGTGLEELDYGVFLNCSSLENVILPPNIKSINFGAFQSCKKLKSIHIGASELTSVRGTSGISGIGVTIYVNNPQVREKILADGYPYNLVLYADAVTSDFVGNDVSLISQRDIDSAYLVLGEYGNFGELIGHRVCGISGIKTGEQKLVEINVDAENCKTIAVMMFKDLNGIEPLAYRISRSITEVN